MWPWIMPLAWLRQVHLSSPLSMNHCSGILLAQLLALLQCSAPAPPPALLISACLILYVWPSSLWRKDPNIDIFKCLALLGRMASTLWGAWCQCLFLAECVIASSRHLPRACLLNDNIRGPQESSTWVSPRGFFMCLWKGMCLTYSQASTLLVEK